MSTQAVTMKRSEAIILETGVQYGTGWLPDYPDFRDFTQETESGRIVPGRTEPTESIKSMLGKTGVMRAPALPASADLRPWCSPIEDQGNLGSCTANAAVGAVEYYERRAFGKYIDASRLFLYKATRDFLHWSGDTGAYLRSTMGALALFGVPPEEFWPYAIAAFDQEPTAFCYAFAANYQAISYYRLDPVGTTQAMLLQRIKTNAAAFLPSIFGFTVYNSIAQASATGKIPFPVAGERVLGGHAIMVVGYDDNMKIKNQNPAAHETTGALLIRNSWGPAWGSSGYGWMPYDYVLRGLASDFWTLLKSEWVNTGLFKV